jgi:hypothetical protein
MSLPLWRVVDRSAWAGFSFVVVPVGSKHPRGEPNALIPRAVARRSPAPNERAPWLPRLGAGAASTCYVNTAWYAVRAPPRSNCHTASEQHGGCATALPGRPTGAMQASSMTFRDAERARLRLEAALCSYRVEFLPANPRVERAAFPSLVGIYWDLTGPLGGLPPTQEVFATHVFQRVGIADPQGVRARAYKAWAAFVRQHHFELALRAHFPLVLRAHALDQAGLDFVLVDDGEAFGLALSVQTGAARDWAKVKQRRHPLPAGLPLLELYLDLDTCPTLPTGPKPLALHPLEQVDEVEDWIAALRAERRAALLAALAAGQCGRNHRRRAARDTRGSAGNP